MHALHKDEIKQRTGIRKWVQLQRQPVSGENGNCSTDYQRQPEGSIFHHNPDVQYSHSDIFRRWLEIFSLDGSDSVPVFALDALLSLHGVRWDVQGWVIMRLKDDSLCDVRILSDIAPENTLKRRPFPYGL